MKFRQHPFGWVPAAERRHVTRAIWRDGDEIAALCGEVVVAVDTTESWFWGTCEPCNVEAHRIVGVPMPGARRRGTGSR
ncbi:zinc finger protein [Saccharopolyspora cebuensis]|uniref:Zinc finger protein n=1 Tax=Saccharopolyspora cebuensis TaxID=418759 RepID=A0ABV4CQN7_9PSEU